LLLLIDPFKLFELSLLVDFFISLLVFVWNKLVFKIRFLSIGDIALLSVFGSILDFKPIN